MNGKLKIYTAMLILILVGCATGRDNPYYRTHHNETEQMLSEGKYKKAIAVDYDMLLSQGDGGKAMREIYLSNENFQNEYSQNILEKINSAATRRKIIVVEKELSRIKRTKIFRRPIQFRLETELNDTVRRGNESGKYLFRLSDQYQFSVLSTPPHPKILFERTIEVLEKGKGDRKKLLSSISEHLSYNNDNEDVMEYIVNHAAKMRITPKEYGDFFSKYIPDFEDKLNKESILKIHLITHKINDFLKDSIEKSINEKSYLLQTVSDSYGNAYQYTVTLDSIKTSHYSGMETVTTVIPRLGGSAISGVIMAFKDVSGKKESLVHDVETKKIKADYKISLCLQKFAGSKRCAVLKNSATAVKKLCSNPMIVRDNGSMRSAGGYPIASVRRECTEGEGKDLNNEINLQIAKAVADRLVKYTTISSHL